MVWLTYLTLIALPIFWVLVDVFGGLRARKFQNEPLEGGESDNFSILVPIYGNVKYLTNAAYLEQYSDRVLLCTTNGETEEFYSELSTVANHYGFRIYRSPYVPIATSKKRRTGGVIRDRVIRDALNFAGELNEYTICIDADTTTPARLEKLVGSLVSTGADFASVELVPQENGGIFVQLQRHEYRQSMRIRYLLPWMLSGACHVGKTRVLRQIMRRHSLFFQGNDVEAGLIGDQLGFTATHLPFRVDTEVPSRFVPWWRQRIAWAGGEFRLFITNIRYIVKHPFLWVYGGFIAILMVGLRWWTVLEIRWWVLAGVIALYYVCVIWIHWRTRNWWLLLLPVYALFSSFVLTPIGILWYFVMAIPEKNFGVISTKRKREIVA